VLTSNFTFGTKVGIANAAASAVLLVFFASGVAAQDKTTCRDGSGAVQTRRIGAYRLQVKPKAVVLPNGSSMKECTATLLSSTNQKVFSISDTSVWEDPQFSGTDINGDGVPEVVVYGEHSGMESFRTCWIVSLGKQPSVILKIEEMCGGVRDSDGDGRAEIWADYGQAFGNFDGLSGAESSNLRAPMAIRLVGTKVVDVSKDFWSAYEELTGRKWGEVINVEQIRRFRSSSQAVLQDCFGEYGPKDPQMVSREVCWDLGKTKASVLRTVILYLFGGREQEAWKTLEEMWPPDDVRRIREEILHTRDEALRNYTSGVAALSVSSGRSTKPVEPVPVSPDVAHISGKYYIKPSVLNRLERSFDTNSVWKCASRITHAIQNPQWNPALAQDFIEQGRHLDGVLRKINGMHFLLVHDIDTARKLYFDNPQEAEKLLSALRTKVADLGRFLESWETDALKRYCQRLPPE
jgi:hypothetical protein